MQARPGVAARRRSSNPTTATRSSSHQRPYSPVACFSPIPPAVCRVGEDEPPPSWDPLLTPKVMVRKGSPKLNMMRRVSPKLSLMAASVSKKKKSPKCSQVKKIGGSSPRAKKRAYWNRTLDKSLVDIMLEHLRNGERADNGWNSEVWNKMYNEFLAKNKDVTYTKNQVQDRQRELKRDYKLLKDAQRESGCSWNYDRQMLYADPHQWKNLTVLSIFINDHIMFV
ncbi:hypothetical protein QOZ80_2BG0195290 [Eleusine coracana subsp. coracana]|nr:hypothetical protein QOZ80_2BG0195290 [Eleusine coracana subsp. coracana]